jgi:hypothetical protein
MDRRRLGGAAVVRLGAPCLAKCVTRVELILGSASRTCTRRPRTHAFSAAGFRTATQRRFALTQKASGVNQLLTDY